jgi:NAD(P)-dependent dehydrogenase (short-subunit alcohol dehydrogenase family)
LHRSAIVASDSAARFDPLAIVAVGATTHSFDGQAVLITGGSRGFGLALGRRFAAEGARLAILARDREELERAAADLRDAGAADVRPIVCDVRDRGAIRDAVDEVVRAFGRVDVLINNAGVIHVAPFARTQEEDFQESLDTHFWAPLHFVKACLPSMIAHGGGRIVNVSSIGGRVPVPHLSAYCAGKFALTGLSETLRMELAPLGIAVTTVSPFIMRTGSHRNATVRGRHEKEATWFALGSSTPLSSIDANDAAREVVAATRARRAHVSPGWQGRAAGWVHQLVPEFTAALGAWITAVLMPGDSRDADADELRVSRDLDLRPLSRLFPTAAALHFNQALAADESIGRRARAHPSTANLVRT